MAENFEKLNLRNPEKERKSALETEALPKIEARLKPSRFPTWDTTADHLFPEILPEKRAAFEKKWQDTDIAALGIDDPRMKEFSEDTRQLNEELGEFIKQKTPKEILDRAQDVFTRHTQEGVSADSVDGLIMAYRQSYEVARLFLTKALMEEAAQSCLGMLWRRIQEIDINDPRKTQLFEKTLGLRKWFPKVRISLARSPEKAGKILAYLLVKGSYGDRGNQTLFNILVSTREIKTRDEKGGIIKRKEVIIGRDSLSQAAKEELRSFIASGEQEKALMAANFLEKKGVLSLEKDADFFDAITKREK